MIAVSTHLLMLKFKNFQGYASLSPTGALPLAWTRQPSCRPPHPSFECSPPRQTTHLGPALRSIALQWGKGWELTCKTSSQGQLTKRNSFKGGRGEVF